MDLELLKELIGSLGFPIVVCLILLIQYNKTIKYLANSINKLAESIKKEADEFKSEIRQIVREEVLEIKEKSHGNIEKSA